MDTSILSVIEINRKILIYDIKLDGPYNEKAMKERVLAQSNGTTEQTVSQFILCTILVQSVDGWLCYPA